MHSSLFSRLLRPLMGLALVLLLSRCDLPSDPAPNFKTNTPISTPLIAEQNYQFLGSDASPMKVIVDTTEADFDSLFIVNPGDNSIAIAETIDDFDFGDLDAIDRSIDIEGIDVSVAIGDLSSQSFNTETSSSIGLFVLEPSVIAGTAITDPAPVPPASAATSITVPNFLVPPQELDLVDFSNVTLDAVTFSDSTLDRNALIFTLTNNSSGITAATLTDVAGTGNAQLTVSEGGNVIGTVDFGQVAVGTTSTGEISLAGVKLGSGDLTYDFNIGPDATLLAAALTQNDGNDVTIAANIDPLEYFITHIANLGAQNNIDASNDEINVSADNAGYRGSVVETGSITLDIENELPFDITLTTLELVNLDAVGNFPANTSVFTRTNIGVPAGQTVQETVPLDGRPIGTRLKANVTASSPGFSGPGTADLVATDGINVSVAGDINIEKLFLVPTAEDFSSSGSFDVDVADVSFANPDEYVELKSGSLDLNGFTNELDIGLEVLNISFPGIRVPDGGANDYGLEDSLVLAFNGGSGPFEFPKLGPNSMLDNINIDLTDFRIYATGNQLSYHVQSTSETANDAREINLSDEIRLTVQATNLGVREVRATINQFSVAITDDVNNDGKLDVLDDAESQISEFDDLDSITDLDLGGLELVGPELVLNLTTDVTADVLFYGALLGTNKDGERVYLGGRGVNAVAPTDTLADDFVAGGSVIAPENLIRFEIPGAAVAGQPQTTAIALNSSTSTIQDFLNNLPESIRFVGKAIVQPGGGQVQLQLDGLSLDAGIEILIPLNLSGMPAFSDTLSESVTDLEELVRLRDPETNKEEDGVKINQARLMIVAENGLPLGVDLTVDVLDANDQVLMTLPTSGGNLTMDPAPTDGSGFSTGTTPGNLTVDLDRNELITFAGGEKFKVNLQLQTPSSSSARLRATDTFSFSVLADLQIEVTFGSEN